MGNLPVESPVSKWVWTRLTLMFLTQAVELPVFQVNFQVAIGSASGFKSSHAVVGIYRRPIFSPSFSI